MRRQSRTDEAFGTECADAQIRTDAAEQDGVGKDVYAVEIDEDSGMAEPCGSEGILVPNLGPGNACRLLNWAAGFGNETADNARPELV